METEQMLHSVGLRSTRARQEVLKFMLTNGQPLSHQELEKQQALGHMDRVTLYRTLESLHKAGLVRRIRGVDGVWRFCAVPQDSSGCPGNHPHFLCISCGRMTCLKDQVMPWVSVPDGARVLGKQLLVYGLCPECAKQGNQPETQDWHS